MANALGKALDSIEAMLDSLRIEAPVETQVLSSPRECEAKDITSSSWIHLNGNGQNSPKKEAANAQRNLLSPLGVSKTISRSRKPNAARRPGIATLDKSGQKKRSQKAPRFSPKKRKSKIKKSRQNERSKGPLGINDDSKESGREGQISEDRSDEQFLKKFKDMAEQMRRAEKRRSDEKNAQIAKEMNVKVGKAEQAMRNLVSSVARDISKTVQDLNHASKTLDEKLKKVKTRNCNEMKSLSSLYSSLKNLSSAFDSQVAALRTEHIASTAKLTKEVHDITTAAKNCVEERRAFKKTLNKVEQILCENGYR